MKSSQVAAVRAAICIAALASTTSLIAGGKPKGTAVFFPSEFRTIDGTENNAANPLWGSADIEFLRLTTVDYEDDAGWLPSGAVGRRTIRRSRGSSRPAITAAAVAVLYFAGKYDDPMADKAFEYAMRTFPISGSGRGHYYYGHLYLSQACYQRGGKDWAHYYPKMSKWLLGQQRNDGSWMGDGVGTTYGTAIALTILQLPYSLVPIYQR